MGEDDKMETQGISKRWVGQYPETVRGEALNCHSAWLHSRKSLPHT